MSGKRAIVRVGLVALTIAGTATVCAIVALGVYVTAQSSELALQSNRLGRLQRQVDELSTDQRLLAAMVASGESTKVAAASTPPTVTAGPPPAAPGTRRLFGKVHRATKQPYGWLLEVDPSEYLTGSAAFSMASSTGKLTNADGSYVLDTSDRTTTLRLLKDADATVASWPGAARGTQSSVSASELVEVLPGGGSASAEWADAWFWLDVREGYVLSVTQQRVK